MKTLVWVEYDNASVNDATLHTVTAAAKLCEGYLMVARLGAAPLPTLLRKSPVPPKSTWPNARYEYALAACVAPQVVELMVDRDAFPSQFLGSSRDPAPIRIK